MTELLNITLAEALVERKALKERITSLNQRLAVNARVQEGDAPLYQAGGRKPVTQR